MSRLACVIILENGPFLAHCV